MSQYHDTQDVLLPALCAWVIPSTRGHLRDLLKMIFWRSKPEPIVRWTFFFNVEIDYKVSVRVTCGLLKKSGLINAQKKSNRF